MRCISDVGIVIRSLKIGNSSTVFDGSSRCRAQSRAQSMLFPSTERIETRALAIDGHITAACFNKTCMYCNTDRAFPSGARVRATIASHSSLKVAVSYCGPGFLMYTRMLLSWTPILDSVFFRTLQSCQHTFCCKYLADDSTHMSRGRARYTLMPWIPRPSGIRNSFSCSPPLCTSRSSRTADPKTLETKDLVPDLNPMEGAGNSHAGRIVGIIN